jgi:hypothetical protein
MANVLAGALLAFSFAMPEVSDSLILAQRQQDYLITTRRRLECFPGTWWEPASSWEKSWKQSSASETFRRARYRLQDH